ncbi:hypothetical protein [Pseudoalteromonas sp. MTN2-4]|uniref:hypothetical protein n=1 Tax=Pseudoalteromonas sp. MTN2-4 TaxID=3056555 RepID=UPI0036F1B746
MPDQIESDFYNPINSSAVFSYSKYQLEAVNHDMKLTNATCDIALNSEYEWLASVDFAPVI